MIRRIFAVFALTLFMSGFLEADKNSLDSIINKVYRSGGVIEKISVQGHVTIKSNDKIADIVNNIYEKTINQQKVKIFENEFSASIIGSNSYIQIKQIPFQNTSDNQYKYYISFELSQHEHKENINNIRDTISKVFSYYNAEPEFSYLLTAKYPRYMTINEMKQNSNAILDLVRCRNIEGMHDRNLVSYYGFMPGYKEKIKLGNEYVNINIGMRAIKDKNYTYLFIGSPIISVEY